MRPAESGVPPPTARAYAGSRSRGRRAGVRPPGSSRAPPPTGIVLAATSGPSTPPPPPPVQVSRPHPAAPRQPSSYEYVKCLYCPLPVPRPRRPPRTGSLKFGHRARRRRRPAEEEEEGRCRRAGERAGRRVGGVGRGQEERGGSQPPLPRVFFPLPPGRSELLSPSARRPEGGLCSPAPHLLAVNYNNPEY